VNYTTVNDWMLIICTINYSVCKLSCTELFEHSSNGF